MTKTALISFLDYSINTRLLSAYLKANGYGVICFFCSEEFNKTNLQELIRILKEKGIGLVGVSLVTDDYHAAVTVTKEIKERLGLPVIWGGAHANVKPEECLRHADMICKGEGEEAMLDLVKSMSDGKLGNTAIQNIWFKTERGMVKNELGHMEEDLDKYPFPDFEPDSQYVMNQKGFERLSELHFHGEYSIMTTRGCPYRCEYCYNNYRWDQYKGKGKYLRARSVKKVIEELSIAKRMFKSLRKINIWDDSFLARKSEDYVEFKNLYSKEIGLPFFALAEPMAFNNEKIQILRDCGLSGLQVGIQSGSERVNREVYNRPVSNEKVLEVANYIHKLGIDVTYDIIFNNPYERLEDLQQTVELFLKFPRPLTLQGYNLIFYPGTALTDKALKDNYISLKPDVEDFSTIQSRTDSPIETGGSGEISSRFYVINYNSREKEYLNTVISLITYQHVSPWIIRFFSRHETPLKRVLLKKFSKLYVALSRIKEGIGRVIKVVVQ